MKRKALRRRYGHMAPASPEVVDKSLRGAPWLERYRAGPEKDECLYEILEAALVARSKAVERHLERKSDFKKADGAIDAIALGKVPKRRDRCETAAAALRKYVQARGGSKAQADVLLP